MTFVVLIVLMIVLFSTASFNISGINREYQTLSEIGVEHNTAIVAMLPVELVHAARKLAGMPAASEG